MSNVICEHNLTFISCLQAGSPQCKPAQHGRRRSERLRALQREIALQKSRQGRQQALQRARRRASSLVFRAQPDPEHLQRYGTPRQSRTRTAPKNSRQVQPVRAVVSQAAAAGSKAQRSVTLARKRREAKAAPTPSQASEAPAFNTRALTAAHRAQQRDLTESMGALSTPLKTFPYMQYFARSLLLFLRACHPHSNTARVLAQILFSNCWPEGLQQC